MPLSDSDLIARVVLNDDRHAFATLMRRHQSGVRGLLRRLTAGDAALADDLAQETFLRAYQSLRRFRGEAKLSTWLYRIAYNGFIDHARKRSESTGLDELPEPATAPSDEASDLTHDLERALRSLRSEERAALALTYAEDSTHPEAAEILGCPVGTLKTHVARAKEKLRRALKSYEPEVSR